MVFKRYENGSPHFEKMVKGGNFKVLNINPYLVTNHSKGLLTRKLIMLRKGFCNIPGENIQTSFRLLAVKVEQLSNFDKVPIWTYKPVIAPLFLF